MVGKFQLYIDALQSLGSTSAMHTLMLMLSGLSFKNVYLKNKAKRNQPQQPQTRQ
jgi:hypothetical protein